MVKSALAVLLLASAASAEPLAEAFQSAAAAITPEKDVVSWDWAADLVTAESALTNLGRYHRYREARFGKPEEKCSVAGGPAFATVSHLLSDAALTAALADPDPTIPPQLAGKLTRFGAIGTCLDRSAFRVRLAGITVLVGDPCVPPGKPEPIGYLSCWDCRDIPPSLQKLVDALKKIDEDMTAKHPSCRIDPA